MMECVGQESDDVENEDPMTDEEVPGIQLIKAYEANDLFYAIAWSYDQNNENAPLVAFGGESGVIRVISMQTDHSKKINVHSKST